MARASRTVTFGGAGTGAESTAWTAPSGTTNGTARGSRIRSVLATNTTAVAAVFNLSRGLFSGGLYMFRTELVPALTGKVFFVDEVLESAELIRFNAEAGVIVHITGEDFILGS